MYCRRLILRCRLFFFWRLVFGNFHLVLDKRQFPGSVHGDLFVASIVGNAPF
ncbi:hypothetical protein M758_11G103800 [Ceratodon purpureus]|nr:hypothetical protein M758_11G103800 [Ceratodon purpureus]